MSIYNEDYADISSEMALNTITPKDEFKGEIEAFKNELKESISREVVDKALQDARNDLDLNRIQRQSAINQIYNMVLERVNTKQLGNFMDRLMSGEDFRTSDLKNIVNFLEVLTKIENMNVNKADNGTLDNDPKRDGVRMVVEFGKTDGGRVGVEHI